MPLNRKTSIALLGTLACSSCLSLNPAHQRAHDLGTGTFSQTSSSATPSVTSSGSTQSTEYSSSSQTTTQSTTSSSTTSTIATTSSTSTTSSNTTTSSTSTTTTSTGWTDTGTGTDGSIAVDFNNGTWRGLRITQPAQSSTAENGYSVQLHFDHAGLVRNGADPSGSNLSLIFVKNGRGYSIDRFLDPSSAWNAAQTIIWFPLQEPLSPGQQSENEYYLVHGSSQFNPKSDPNEVFVMYDNFASNQIDSTKWAQSAQGGGSSGIDFTGFGVKLHASSLGAQDESRSLVSKWNGRYNGVLAEAMLRFPNPLMLSCNVLRPLAFETRSDNLVRHGLGINSGNWQRLQYSAAQNNIDAQQIPTMTLNQSWNRYAIAWRNNTLEAWMASTLHVNQSTSGNPVPRPDSQELQLRLQTAAKPSTCTGQDSSEVDVDWVWIRHFDLPEPSADLIP